MSETYELPKDRGAIVLNEGERKVQIGVMQLPNRKKKSLYFWEGTEVRAIPIDDDNAKYIVELIGDLEGDE